MLHQFRLHSLAPIPGTDFFLGWWEKFDKSYRDQAMRALNSLIALGAWILWNHRNRIVFDGLSPSVSTALRQAREEQQLWEMAGAKGRSFLAATTRLLAACCSDVIVLTKLMDSFLFLCFRPP
jgi:hypothetical protein